MIFNEIPGKNVTYDTKSDTKQSLVLTSNSIFLKHIFKVKAWIFFNETSILVFAELAVFHFIHIRKSLGKTVRKITM